MTRLQQQRHQYYQKRYDTRKAAGLCTQCRAPPNLAKPGHTQCDMHLRRLNGRRAEKRNKSRKRQRYSALTTAILNGEVGCDIFCAYTREKISGYTHDPDWEIKAHLTRARRLLNPKIRADPFYMDIEELQHLRPLPNGQMSLWNY